MKQLDNKTTITLGYIVSIALLLIGITGIVIYAILVISVLGDADQSAIFWGVPLVLVGIFKLIIGGALIYITSKAKRENQQAIDILKLFLKIILFILLFSIISIILSFIRSILF